MTDRQQTHDQHQGGHHPKAPTLLIELREHIPFSVSAVAIGLIVTGVICVLCAVQSGAAAPVGEIGSAGHDHDGATKPAQLFFHLFHPAHMLFSATATAAMFRRYDRGLFKAIVVGLIGAIGVCGVSDIVIPHVSLAVFGVVTPWHICVYEHPTLVLPFAAIGVLVGVFAAEGVIRSTIISHSLHVLTSTMASIFYMVEALGLVAWIDDLGKVFIFVVLAVMVPCCVSDIVFPLLMSKSGRDRYELSPHVH